MTKEPFEEPFLPFAGIVSSGTEFGSIGLRAGKLMEGGALISAIGLSLSRSIFATSGFAVVTC